MKELQNIDQEIDKTRKFEAIGCSFECLANGCMTIKSSGSGFAISDLEHVRRNQISIEVDVSFEKNAQNANAFLVFGDHPNHKNRVCVGLYSSKGELWIEEQPEGALGLKKVRMEIPSSDQNLLQGVLKVMVDLDTKLINLTFMDNTIQSKYKRHLGGLRWIGCRVYNTQATFGPIRLSDTRSLSS